MHTYTGLHVIFVLFLYHLLTKNMHVNITHRYSVNALTCFAAITRSSGNQTQFHLKNVNAI